MKKIVAAILLLMPLLACAEKPKPNPADYTIDIHVRASRLVSPAAIGGSVTAQHLTAVINGRTCELEDSGWNKYLLRVGDYKARIVEDKTTGTYGYLRIYEFLFPDGSTRQFTVVGEDN